MTPVEIAYIVVAVAIVVLVIFLACFLFKLTKTVENLNQKMGALDPLFRAASNASECLEHKTASLKEHTLCTECSHKKSAIEPYVRLAIAALSAWENNLKRR